MESDIGSSHKWSTLGASLGLPHHIATWGHLVVQAFLFSWCLSAYLNGIPVSYYYVNIIFYGATTVIGLAGIAAFSINCCHTPRAVVGGSYGIAQAAHSGDKFYYVTSFFLSMGLLLIAIFVFSLDVTMARDPLAVYTNFSLDGVDLNATATTVPLFTYATNTYLLGMGSAALHFVAFCAVLLVYHSNTGMESFLRAMYGTGMAAAASSDGIELGASTSALQTGAVLGKPLLSVLDTNRLAAPQPQQKAAKTASLRV